MLAPPMLLPAEPPAPGPPSSPPEPPPAPAGPVMPSVDDDPPQPMLQSIKPNSATATQMTSFFTPSSTMIGLRFDAAPGVAAAAVSNGSQTTKLKSAERKNA